METPIASQILAKAAELCHDNGLLLNIDLLHRISTVTDGALYDDADKQLADQQVKECAAAGRSGFLVVQHSASNLKRTWSRGEINPSPVGG